METEVPIIEPGLVLVASDKEKFNAETHDEKFNLIFRHGYPSKVKYLYQNKDLSREYVRREIINGTIDLSRYKITYVETYKFNTCHNGQLINLTNFITDIFIDSTRDRPVESGPFWVK